ncbi:hypothetical protein F2A37_04065 [Pseudomonas chlororaphis]|nr:hypothetical protein [Pseudomonas chlororaphis]KAA5847185.1 hypothetical protein F2A37_04065 [Pseudomonas chlororaphis]
MAGRHLSELQLVGKDAAHMFVTLLIGMVLGAIIALQRVPDLTKRKPLAAALFDRLHLLVQLAHPGIAAGQPPQDEQAQGQQPGQQPPVDARPGQRLIGGRGQRQAEK